MTRTVETKAARILVRLYLVEAAVLLILVGIYKAPIYDWTLLSTKAGAVLFVGGVGLVASVWLLVRETKVHGSLRRRAFALGLMTNFASGLIVFLVAEGTVQIVSARTEAGIVVGSVAVRPTWSELIAQSRGIVAGATTPATSYFVYDRELGWTVGSNRRSSDGFYFSSVEGIRSAGPDLRMADWSPRYRVALIGDSNAFSYEVPFEDSWGHHLQRVLGDDVQVLNFGVDGYGIDQVYLRYQRDVRPWKPNVVMVGFSGHDLWRTMVVYPLVTFGWPGYLVKPRFTVESGELKLLNLPLPTPDEILGTRRVQELPFIEYDLGYGTSDWSWRFDHGPLVLRFLSSVYPRWPIADRRVSDEAVKALNSRLFTQLVESIKGSGAVPIVVLMSPRNAVVSETLSRAGVPFLDADECVTGVPADGRRVPSGHHYTGLANRAIAECTASRVQYALKKHRDPARGAASSSTALDTSGQE